MNNEVNFSIINDTDIDRRNAEKFEKAERERYDRNIENVEEYLNSLRNNTKVATEIKKSPFEEKLDQYYREHYNFKTPKSEVEAFVKFGNEEEYEDDIVFGNYIPVKSELRIEDHKQFIYNTLPVNMYVMYPNNMVAPIVRHPNIASKTQGYFNKQRWAGEFVGVYIVEYFSLKMLRANTREYDNVMKYLKYAHSAKMIENVVFDNLNELLARGNCGNKYLRIITIVTSSDLMRNNPIYIPHTGLCIGDESILDNYTHPATNGYKHNVNRMVKSTNKNYIEIDIVDNTTNNDYYIKVGNKILKLEQERDPSKREQVGISLWKNNIEIDNDYVNLDKIHSLGIYNTRKQAEVEGNLGKEIENRDRELRNEENKLRAQELASENSVKEAHYKTTKIGLEMQREIARNEFEKDKLKAEKEMLKLKHQYEIESTMLDIENKYQEIFHELIRGKLGIMSIKEKYNLEKEKYMLEEAKYDMEMKKIRESKVTSTVETIGKIIKLIGSCL